MSKQRPSGKLFLCGSTNPPPQQHLYLIFDGLGSEYGIRKVDLNQLPPTASTIDFKTASTIKARNMPPPEFRLHAPRGMPMYFAAAFDTKILAMHPRELNGVVHPMVSNNYFLVLDVHTPSLMYGPQPKAPRIDPIYIPVGDMLFALAVGSFEVLYAPPPPPSPDEPRYWEWSWSKLMKPPFKPKNVTSYTVHPDGRTIFVSNSALRRAHRHQLSPSTRWWMLLSGSYMASGFCRSRAVLTSTMSWMPGLGSPEIRKPLATSAAALWFLLITRMPEMVRTSGP